MNLSYILEKEKHSITDIKNFIKNNKQIKFVSFMGIDLLGNDIEQRIPMDVFIEDIDGMLHGGVQTDGSSVAFPEITSLNNAKLDIIADLNCHWYIEYNYDLKIYIEEAKKEMPVGTLIIPCFLFHNGKGIDSRYILKSSMNIFSREVKNIINKSNYLEKNLGIKNDEVVEIINTTATELEFWIKTPNERAHIENLTVSQTLKEQYWSKLRGDVKTAVEETLLLMSKYELNPEMGHKEVGGIRASLDCTGKFNHIMEQIEIDWKYSTAIQTADNEYLVKNIIRETFRKYGLDVTFMAKPIPKVAGSGKHTHIGIAAKLKSGKIINLFTAIESNHFLSKIGYGSIMGLLKNYDTVNTFVSTSTDAFNRLKPGFEAPVCAVTSLGHSVEEPSRNRSILIGLIRDLNNDKATRFELRSPNPKTNTYLTCSAIYTAMIEGIKYSMTKNSDELLTEISKSHGEFYGYLDKDREYRSELDVFEAYSEEERNRLYGKAPKNVYENMLNMENADKMQFISENPDFKYILDSYKSAVLQQWHIDTISRYLTDVKNECKNILNAINKQSFDIEHNKAKGIKRSIETKIKYLFSNEKANCDNIMQLIEAAEVRNYKEMAVAKTEIDKTIDEIRELYSKYKKYSF